MDVQPFEVIVSLHLTEIPFQPPQMHVKCEEKKMWSVGIHVKDVLTIFTSNGSKVVLHYLQNFWLLCSMLSVGIIYTSKQLFSNLKIFEYSANKKKKKIKGNSVCLKNSM